MDLSQAQVDAFRRDGFLVIERAFSSSEVAVLNAALPEIMDPSRAKVGFDGASGMVRLSHGAHLYNEAFRRLSLHPRLVQPVQRLIESDFHVYQSRLTIKPGMTNGVAASGWVWHQDYSTWHRADGMPEPRAVVTFTFLDDVTAANAPVLAIPRSHDRGMYDTISVEDKGDYENVAIIPDTVREIGQRNGVIALTGPVGTIVFISCALVHASGENISPLRRALFSVVYNPMDNRPRHPRTQEHWVPPADVVPVRPLADNCLATMPS
jgi:ectoine hydroxylase